MMRGAIFLATGLTLARDRAALVMAFVLPALVFVIFALIFAGASGGEITVRLAIADEQASEASQRFVEGLAQHARIERVGGDLTARQVRDLVRTDRADAGVVIRSDARPLADLAAEGREPVLVVGDPTREIAASVTEGAVQEVLLTTFAEGVPGLGGLVQRTSVGQDGVSPAISYYAGAVAAMFLLFSALNGALTLLTEKESGLIARISTGPGGPGVVIDGKLAFLVVQGVVQVLIIFLVAWIGFGVDLPGNILYWLITTLIASVAAAALALGFVSICGTHVQAQTVGTVAVIVISAFGGSMVPRFLMPETIRDIGWATPNAWAIDAYNAIFWRGEGWDALVLPWAVLAAIAAGGLAVAYLFARRRA